jgi:HPt (histidine-containing phosphotransfer) domain-containing protein
VSRSLGEGDRATAERAAHSVKGTAGNLGAEAVQASAAAVERAIREGVEPSVLEPLRAELGRALERLAVGLRPWLGPEAKTAALPEAAGALDAATAKGLVERWSRLLAECDAGTSDGVETEASVLRGLFGDDESFRRFRDQVTSYEFEEALEALRRAAHQKGL